MHRCIVVDGSKELVVTNEGLQDLSLIRNQPGGVQETPAWDQIQADKTIAVQGYKQERMSPASSGPQIIIVDGRQACKLVMPNPLTDLTH